MASLTADFTPATARRSRAERFDEGVIAGYIHALAQAALRPTRQRPSDSAAADTTTQVAADTTTQVAAATATATGDSPASGDCRNRPSRVRGYFWPPRLAEAV